jgi:pilus assembly protein Flp/PilA
MSANELRRRVIFTRGRGSRRVERGASAVEYGLLIAGVAAIIAIMVFAFGDNIADVFFEDTCQELVDHRNNGDCV